MSLPPPRLVPVPDLATDPSFTVQWIDVARVVAGYRAALYAFEWLRPDGTVKSTEELSAAAAAERKATEQAFRTGVPLPMPILGWGMLDHVEIGAGRSVIMTAQAIGIKVLPVHIATSAQEDLANMIVPAPRNTRESGNVLMYILLAIVLLAALSYAVSRTSGSGSTAYLSDNQASTAASEILTYAQGVRTAVDKLRLRGCTAAQLNFENGPVAGYINAGAPSDDSCDVFSPAGGAVTWATPPTDMNDGTPWLISGRTTVHQAGGVLSGNSASEADLAMILFGLSEAVCLKINSRLGISSVPVNDGSFGDTTKFQGAFAYAEDINGLPEASQPSPCGSPSTANNFCGRDAGCFLEESGGQRYVFYQVLLQR